jgi:TolB protein
MFQFSSLIPGCGLSTTPLGLKKGVAIMEYKMKTHIVLFIFLLLFINSCKENSNPIFPTNTGNSTILFSANQKLAVINADGRNYQIIPVEANIATVANLSYDALKVVYGSVDTTYQQISLFNINKNETIKITDDNLFHDSPVISPDNNSVLFLTRFNWKYRLYLKNIVTGNVKVLNNNLNAYNPVFSSDGSKIVCCINNGGDSAGIVLMDNDGSNLKLIGKGDYPEFSPDGKKILYQNPIPPNDEGLYIMNVDGTDSRFISSIPFQTKPRFSHDGSKILFSKFTDNYDLYLINIDGCNLINLTNSPEGETQPVFTTDGSKIVFVLYDSVSRINKLCSMNIDGTNKKVIYEDSSNYGIKIF